MSEHPKNMARELATGESSRTPTLALTGLTVIISVVVGVILAIALIVYYVA